MIAVFKMKVEQDADCEGDGLKVRPAVHHSRSEARSGFQVLPYVFSESAE